MFEVSVVILASIIRAARIIGRHVSTIEILLTVSHRVAELPGEHRQLGHVDVLLGPAGLRQVELPASLALSPGVAETLIMMSVNHKVLILVSWEPGKKALITLQASAQSACKG